MSVTSVNNDRRAGRVSAVGIGMIEVRLERDRILSNFLLDIRSRRVSAAIDEQAAYEV
jgi:hypothetical protein